MKAQNNNIDFPDFFQTYKWFGASPFSSIFLNDLADEGYVFVTSDKYRDEKCYAIGEKMLE